MTTSWVGPSSERRRSDGGQSAAELLAVLGVVTIGLALSLPLTTRAVDTGRGRQAAAFVAGRLRGAQLDAIRSARSVAAVFDQSAEGWTLRVCRDGNRNGVRRAELTDGPDTCTDGPYSIDDLFRGVAIAVSPALPGPDSEPPSPDPVRFGADMASFSATGAGTAGSVFLRSADGRHYLVRVTGVTGRVRVMRHNPWTNSWELL
jgi:Tfp pilus assembly protein FimT